MKTTLQFTLLVIVSFTLSCLKSGGGNGGVGITAIDLTTSLPNGRWEGTGHASGNDGLEVQSDMTLIIDDNEIKEEFFTAGRSGHAIHSLKYTEKGKAEWLSQQGNVKGGCQCFTKSCHCFSDDGRGIKYQMSLSFASHELDAEQSGDVNGHKYHNVYKLKIK